MAGVLVVFLDGVGIGPPDPNINPFFSASLPTLSDLLGGRMPSLHEPFVEGKHGRAFPIDACLGVQGTPQSGTGQVALLTGLNAPRLFGRHFGPWPPVRLRPLLQEENFLSKASDVGVPVVFANAYPRDYPTDRDSRRVAAIPLAAHSAGLLERSHPELARGVAVASEIVNDGWIHHLGHRDLPSPNPREAGANLGRLAKGGLTFFAHYHTDVAGHRGGMSGAVRALERVDGFIAGIMDAMSADTRFYLVSDHGNIEDVRGGHTLNPALGLALGSASSRLPDAERLTNVAELILSAVTR